MTALKWLLLIAVVGYGGVLGLMYVFQRALMYFRTRRARRRRRQACRKRRRRRSAAAMVKSSSRGTSRQRGRSR
jgi:hypothetical protein